MNILITGSSGFIGKHLKNTLNYKHSKKFTVTGLNKKDFTDQKVLDNKVKQSSVIIHLAAINRHSDQDFLFETNINLSKKIIESIEKVNFKGKVIFASSTQEILKNNYGKSKSISRNLFIESSKKNNFTFTALIIPNVFGPFGKTNYNSFIPTFCDNIIKDQEVEIINNNQVKLIYIDNLIKIIVNEFQNESSNYLKELKEDVITTVEEVRNKLIEYRSYYIIKSSIPDFQTEFDLNLFNTFRSYINHDEFFPVKHIQNTDDRGDFVEIIRSYSKGQYSFSTTKPNIIRGNHFHTRKIERFSVIQGEALIKLRKIDTNDILEFKLSGNTPSYVDMPIWYTHNIKNIGSDNLVTLFWINEPFDKDNSDTYIENV